MQLAVADIATGAISLVTHGASGQNLLLGETNLAWSADSQRLTFVADYAVTPDAANSVGQVFETDLRTGQTTAAPTPGVVPDRESRGVAVAAESTVAFSPRASNLVPDDGSGATGPPDSVPGFPGSARDDVYVQGPAFAAFALPTVRVTGTVDTRGLPGVAGVMGQCSRRIAGGGVHLAGDYNYYGRYETLVPANSTLTILVTRHLADGSDSIEVLENRSVGNADTAFNFTLSEWVDNTVHVRGVGGGDVQGAQVQWLGAPMFGGVSPDGFPVRLVWMPTQLPCVTGQHGTCVPLRCADPLHVDKRGVLPLRR